MDQERPQERELPDEEPEQPAEVTSEGSVGLPSMRGSF